MNIINIEKRENDKGLVYYVITLENKKNGNTYKQVVFENQLIDLCMSNFKKKSK